MNRFFLFIFIIVLAFLTAGFTVPERLTIVDLNTKTLLVGNRELKIGESFNSDQIIYWESERQAAEVQDNTGQLYIFTKEAFNQKKVKTPKEYLVTGKFSTRPAFDSPKPGRNKSSFPEKRVAMVIGNSNYVSRADFLRAPIADAGMISEKLVELGFDTFSICDASSADLFKAVAKFSEVASKYDIALFYYAGHGFCYNHNNYYQPVDVSDIDYNTVHSCLKASELMGELSNKAAKGTILVMDACRSIAKVRGEDVLAPIEASPGMMIFCSTSDGKAAIDAIGENSPFAKAFSENLFIEGQPLYAVARKTMNDVRKITSGAQTPSFNDQFYEDFYFYPQRNKGGAVTVSNNAPFIVTEPASEQSDIQEYVDLGLSVRWASCNLGATKPEEYGGYYQWAGLQDVTSTSIDLYWDNCPYHNGNYESTGWTKYNANLSYGTVDNKEVLDPDDDVAHVTLGGNWRMPTEAEWIELRDDCIWTWTMQNKVVGYKVTSKKSGYTDKSIFLPAAGCRLRDDIIDAGSRLYYWSSSLDSRDNPLPYYAFCLYGSSEYLGARYYARCNGRPVRPVTE